MKTRPFFSRFFGLALTLLLCACSVLPGQVKSPSSAPLTLKITVLPILESLPMYVAQQEGYFAAHGVDVQVIPSASAPERDQLIASGQVDGMINELLGAVLYNKDQTQVQVVRYARAATSDAALFRILASKSSGITTIAGLKGAQIGVSNGTIIEYLTDRLLQKEGFNKDEIKKVAVPKLSDRLALLASGGLNAAVLPEPQTELAIQQGAVVVLDDTSHPEFSFSTVTFRKAVIDQHPEAIRGFLAAWEDAVKQINQNPNQYNDLLVKQKILPQPLAGAFHTPKFVTAGVPTAAQFMDVVSWAKQANLLTVDPQYDQTVNASFLPK
ncbi:MAG TPA: ABC transporter substrate-binding protein [Anaerolineaceae bacterium]